MCTEELTYRDSSTHPTYPDSPFSHHTPLLVGNIDIHLHISPGHHKTGRVLETAITLITASSVTTSETRLSA